MTTLDRTRFEHLYLNANSIAEIALLRALDRAAAPRPEPTLEQRAANEALVHALNHPDPATFDWSALQGVYGFDGPLDAAPAAAGTTAPPPARLPGFDEMVGFDDDEDLDAPVDIGRYLQRVDAARPQLQPRIDDCFARADIAALESALATLPGDRPPLTATLTPDAFTRWLELYEAHHDGMEATVHGIRRLEPILG
ncbi:MAG TPA: hypothetical protein VIN75_23740 [Burkholderiaceae bacterium]